MTPPLCWYCELPFTADELRPLGRRGQVLACAGCVRLIADEVLVLLAVEEEMRGRDLEKLRREAGWS